MKILRSLAILALVFAAMSLGHGQQPTAAPNSLSMSAELLELLRAEMRELVSATQAISMALPVGDWTQIVATSEQMRSSYILERKLTESQREELGRLPERFKHLDKGFHLKTEKLAHAASEKDVGLTAYYFARLLEDCADCHAAYAPQRFPGFSDDSTDQHQQH